MQSSGKPLRKTVEKNRRIKEKQLREHLHSLISPPLTTREIKLQAPPRLEQLDNAMNYIQELQERIERLKERKKQLLDGLKLPSVEVQNLGMGLKVIITSSPGDWFAFNQAIRVISCEEGAEIVNANFTGAGDQAIHIIHAMVKEPMNFMETNKLLKRLKEIDFVV